MPLRPVPVVTDADLTARVHAILDARLQRDVAHPVAVALSGGGDSMALLALAADWAAIRGRRLLALTVDHRLNPDSAGWSDMARRAAESLGAEWHGLNWTDDKPTAGLPAAARRARHALIGTAARAAKARVVLFAHTADDVAESAMMQAEGSTLGTLRGWNPSPAWPEGRGLMLCRPLLGERRRVLRDYLTARGLDWIEDPSNEDMRFGRSRARRALLNPLPTEEGLRLAERSDALADPKGGAKRQRVRGYSANRLAAEPLTLSRKSARLTAHGRSSPLPLGEGTVKLDRAVDHHTLAVTLVCAGGGDVTPRGARLDRLIGRLRAGEDFAAVLCGARVLANGAVVIVTREPGEFARKPRPPLPLTPGVAAVWDGRFEIETDQVGWCVVPAVGHVSALSSPERAAVRTLPPAARGALPVLMRDGSDAPVLAWRRARVRALVGERLASALDQTTHERDLMAAMHGATPSYPLFLDETFKADAGAASVGKPRTA